MWTFTNKASFVTFFVQIKEGALWKLPKEVFGALKILFICNIFCTNQGKSPLEASRQIFFEVLTFQLKSGGVGGAAPPPPEANQSPKEESLLAQRAPKKEQQEERTQGKITKQPANN